MRENFINNGSLGGGATIRILERCSNNVDNHSGRSKQLVLQTSSSIGRNHHIGHFINRHCPGRVANQHDDPRRTAHIFGLNIGFQMGLATRALSLLMILLKPGTTLGDHSKVKPDVYVSRSDGTHVALLVGRRHHPSRLLLCLW